MASLRRLAMHAPCSRKPFNNFQRATLGSRVATSGRARLAGGCVPGAYPGRVEILWWLAPPVVATVLAMVWVSWLGREGRGEVDREVAVRRLGDAMSRPTRVSPHRHTAPRAPSRVSAAPGSPSAVTPLRRVRPAAPPESALGS